MPELRPTVGADQRRLLAREIYKRRVKPLSPTKLFSKLKGPRLFKTFAEDGLIPPVYRGQLIEYRRDEDESTDEEVWRNAHNKVLGDLREARKLVRQGWRSERPA